MRRYSPQRVAFVPLQYQQAFDIVPKFNEKQKAEYIANRLVSGENLALISDAGMPLISDPGKTLVDELIKRKLEYTVVSGPCAMVNAVVLSGMDTSSFCMVGFLPEKTADRKRVIEKFENLPTTLVFYSPPHNIDDDLKFLADSLGDRKVSIVREISKMHEEVIRGSLTAIPDFTHKGEFVIVVEGAIASANPLNEMSVIDHINAYIGGGMDKKDAIKQVAQDRKVAKSVIYAEYEKQKKNG
ncbi:MAG: rRNA small subunit methyltransferase 1 [Clostridia bacterium]|nr:rRNA small subunit methyltransferase 1 [Clostridia bacterium]